MILTHMLWLLSPTFYPRGRTPRKMLRGREDPKVELNHKSKLFCHYSSRFQRIIVIATLFCTLWCCRKQSQLQGVDKCDLISLQPGVSYWMMNWEVVKMRMNWCWKPTMQGQVRICDKYNVPQSFEPEREVVTSSHFSDDLSLKISTVFAIFQSRLGYSECKLWISKLFSISQWIPTSILACLKVNWWKTKEFRKTFMQSQHTLHGKKFDKGRFLSRAGNQTVMRDGWLTV